MNMEFTSIKDIASEIYSHPLMRDLPFERIIRDTLELIQITGCPNLFESKEEILEISQHRTVLPCDYYQINQLFLEDDNKDRLKAFKPSTSSLSIVNDNDSADLTYTIKGNILYTSIKEGKVRIAYESIKLDDEGYPLIINNASFIRALKSYIKMNWFTILFDSNIIKGDVLQNAQQEYGANIAQAQNSLIMPDIDHMENISRIMNDAMTRQFEHSRGFKDINKSHKIRIY